ncbi:MAG: SpoVG family protein [Candidatus Omnitrophica bacterium]|nr:SpoVG family protein [Candidatus Omnitrophota bacterium]MDD5352264.1 SpoVG family protein [Candidatus Omnitrophota bacterium]MDD5549862.1 SpoVG family protein [Candidatus Omnitrophota bacterium]
MISELKFKVTRLHRIEGKSNIRAFVDIALNESLLLKGLRIVEGKNGLFVSMPREKGKDNKWYETIHPLSNQVKEDISNVVLSAYNV